MTFINTEINKTTRIDYELTYYINDVNTEHTQVLMEYGKRDELKNVYTYGNERIAAETLVQAYSPDEDQYATDYYLYDGRGSVAQVLRADEIATKLFRRKETSLASSKSGALKKLL